MEVVKYLGSFNYVDVKWIGIFGWSYGGYMLSFCIFKSLEQFKVVIVVVFVINWKWYDSIYMECYMCMVDENEEGYC